MKRKIVCVTGAVVLLAALLIFMTVLGETRTVTWLDADGAVLWETELSRGEEVPTRSLPDSTEAWRYTEWHEQWDGKTGTVTARRQPVASYFVGNIFRIIVKDLSGTVVSVGTGFVFDKAGWFITNSHVMKDGYDAVAEFAVGDRSGSAVTVIEEIRGFSNRTEADIFVGKIEGYGKIADYYRDLPIGGGGDGEIAFSVTYADGGPALCEGRGESGLLLDGALRPCGFATAGDTWATADQLAEYTASSGGFLQTLGSFLHPDEEMFISYFRGLAQDSTFRRLEEGNRTYYRWDKTSAGVGDRGGSSYDEDWYVLVYENGWVEYVYEIFFADGDTRWEMFCGYYSPKEHLENFSYSYRYTWASGNYMEVFAENIAYSSDLSLTLPEYEMNFRHGSQPNSSNIDYMKQRFNGNYEFLNRKLYR